MTAAASSAAASHAALRSNVFHLVKNHPFVDGNKRAGLAVGLAFLALNDVLVAATDEELVELILSVAAGTRSKADVAVFFRSHARE